MRKVGIIGNGFVGESIAFAFSPTCDIKIYDIDPLKSMNSFTHTIQQDFVFICLPTPMNQDGSQNLDKIDDFFCSVPANSDSIFILKSTVLPGTTKSLIQKWGFKIVFSPEFLTERTAKLDMLTQARIILGGDIELTSKVEELFADRFMNRHFIHMDSTSAEFVKYMNNTFFATKVSLMNEFYRLGMVIGVDWDKCLYGFAADGRIGDSHLHVPGPDGKLGFGGTCFPKDINAIIDLAKKIGCNMNVLEAAWKTNLEVRPEQDWRDLKGRAIIK